MRLAMSRALASLVTLIGVASPLLVHAQEASVEGAAVLDEIIVTARKREETLQESPVAISAFGAEALREAGVSTMRDLSNSVPGMVFSEAESKSTSIYIRGIGQKEANAVLDPSVGVYINGVFIARTDSQLLDTVDTESIQVLRGPQGTLFGKNTTGGAILVTTMSPTTDAFSGSVSTRVGNFGRRDAKVSLNVPLNEDSLAMRVSVNSVKRDGYLNNAIDERTFGDEDRIAATARVLWQPNDIFSADLFTYFSKRNENGVPFTCLMGNPNANLAGQLAYPGQEGSLSAFSDACHRSEALADSNKVTVNQSAYKMTSEIAAITLMWDLDDVEIKSITSVAHQNDIVVEDDADGTSIGALQNGALTLESYVENSGMNYDPEKRQQYGQEFDINGSALNEALTYTVGAFYSVEKMDNTPFTQQVGPGTFAAANLLLQPPFNSVVSTHKLLGTQSDLDTETSALFSQVTYDVTDWFQTTIGARYTTERRERDLSVYSVDFSELASRVGGQDIATDPLLGQFINGVKYPSIEAFNAAYEQYAAGMLDIPLNPVPVTDNAKKTWTKFTPSLTLSFNHLENYLQWESLDGAMLYFTYSKGFKAGGFEPKDTELVAFDPEEVTNYEFGGKFDGFDHRLRVNTALYYMSFADMQKRIAEKGRRIDELYLYLSNVGKAVIKGYEVEIYGQPTENLTVVATFNYTDGEYKDFKAPVIQGTDVVFKSREDEPFGGSPKKSASLVVSYNIETESAGLFVPRLTAYYRDELYIGLDSLSPDYEQSYLDSYTLLGARLTWLPSDPWSITLFVDNVADKEYYQGGFSVMDALGAATVVKGPPRTYGLEASYDF